MHGISGGGIVTARKCLRGISFRRRFKMLGRKRRPELFKNIGCAARRYGG
jgi:hypothetical protein